MELDYKFWKEYYESDLIGRLNKIKPIVENIEKALYIKDKILRKNALTTILNGYFEDLVNFMLGEARRETK